MIEGIDEMLSKGISFSLYMTHGGTNWGHWAGANSPGYAPDVTSYDYDAPISESGQTTPKYWDLRKTLSKYNNGKKLPPVPKTIKPISIKSSISLKSHHYSQIYPSLNKTRKYGQWKNMTKGSEVYYTVLLSRNLLMEEY